MSGENILKGCLVESDPEKIARARQAKRRALIIAIILQVLLVGLLVLAPLLGAVEKLPNKTMEWIPAVPYRGAPKPSEAKPAKSMHEPRKPTITTNKPGLVAPTHIPPTVAVVNDPPEAFARPGEIPGNDNVIGDPNGLVDLNAASNRNAAVPKPPETAPVKVKRPPMEVPPAVQEARLVRRVEPKYPPLPKSAGLEGKVVLRAIIAKDGTIQSLEVVSGSPLFIAATTEAILQWRYQPTLLHGEPVEVETMITVFFTLRR